MEDRAYLLAICCGGCLNRWAGSERAHCRVCHATFDDVELFDLHRGDGRCLSGRALGLVMTKNGIWHREAGRGNPGVPSPISRRSVAGSRTVD
ncbi:hypothetical protein [Pseudonocardia spinosispora]|uniref:FDXHR family putative zinc-binding protein n=1 Tax=Pseudonocardia spinosispora TaxID=103441 RepID=UPI00055AB4A0